MGKEQTGGAIQIGEWQELGEAVDEWNEHVGAATPLFMDPRATARARASALANVNARLLSLKKAAASRPMLRPVVKMAQTATKAFSLVNTARAAAAQASTRAAIERLNMPTHITSVCFDGVAAVTASGTATVKAPHNNPWRLTSIHTNDSQCTGMRIISFILGGTEHVVSSNVTFDAGSPTSPGWDAAVFSGKMQALIQPHYRFRPWGLGKGGVLRSDAELKFRAYNPGAAAASLNLTVFCQSSPCGDDSLYVTDKGGVYPMKSEKTTSFLRSIMSGKGGLWPQ